MDTRGVPAPPIVWPDYRSSIVNLMASVEAGLGSAPPHPPLAGIEASSLRERSAVVVLVLDGLGQALLDRHRPAYLGSLPGLTVTTVYPSTTAAAIPSLMSGLTPLEHGAIGWSLFFKELGRYIDFLPFRDSVDGSRQVRGALDGVLRVPNLFHRIAAAGVATWYVGPRFVVNASFADESSLPATRLGYGRMERLVRRLVRAAKGTGGPQDRAFVFCYVPEPDHTIHHAGTGSEATAAMIRRLDTLVERTAHRLRGSGATILVTADHGLTDTPVNHYLDENREAYGSLVLAPFPEKRFLSFHVKSAKREAFPRFMERYDRDFLLLSREEMLRRGVLGSGAPHPKIDDFLGDWVALAVGEAQMHTRIRHPNHREKRFVAHHAGLRREEMVVPVLRIDT